MIILNIVFSNWRNYFDFEVFLKDGNKQIEILSTFDSSKYCVYIKFYQNEIPQILKDYLDEHRIVYYLFKNGEE